MNSRFHQRGAVALVVALVLLFGMTLIAFFANRTMIFEQRTSANQYRYTKAFEVADAGIEWAIARLNDGLTLTANSCTPASGAGLVSFRDRYVRPTAADATHANGWLNPLNNVYPGCQIDPAAGTLSCGCPAAGAATLAATAQPRFRVQFNPVTSPTADALAVEIISRGCTSGDPCDPASAATASDSSVVARVLVKIVPTFPTVPGAGLISGSATVISGSLNVVNTDTAGNGITINTGSTVNLSGSGVTVQTLPGQDSLIAFEFDFIQLKRKIYSESINLPTPDSKGICKIGRITIVTPKGYRSNQYAFPPKVTIKFAPNIQVKTAIGDNNHQ